MIDANDDVGFGGGDEDGALCGCQRRVKTPFCPWCGRQIDDAGTQLLAYLERLLEQNRKAADTKERNGSAYPAHRWRRTVERLRQKADQQESWARWVRERLGS